MDTRPEVLKRMRWQLSTVTSTRWDAVAEDAGESENGVVQLYQFTYNTDATPHLTGITNNISTAENYTFSYTVAQTLYAPFAPQTAFGTAQMLQTVTRTGVNLTHTFEYGTNGAGEMSRAIQSFMLGECLMP